MTPTSEVAIHRATVLDTAPSRAVTSVSGFHAAIPWALEGSATGRGFRGRYGWRPDGATKVDTSGDATAAKSAIGSTRPA